MNWLVIALLLLLPGDVKADDHVNETLCDEIVRVLREYRIGSGLTTVQVERLAGNCYDQVDQINEESRSLSDSQESEEDTTQG